MFFACKHAAQKPVKQGLQWAQYDLHHHSLNKAVCGVNAGRIELFFKNSCCLLPEINLKGKFSEGMERRLFFFTTEIA